MTLTLIGENSIAILDVVGGRVIDKVKVGTAPHNLALDMNGRVWVANTAETFVSVVDGQTGQLVRIVELGRDAHGVALGPNGKYAYVSSMGEGKVTVVDASSGRVVGSVSVGVGSDGVRQGPQAPMALRRDPVKPSEKVEAPEQGDHAGHH